MTDAVERVELVERVDELDRVVGVVERDEAIRRGWLHRVATTVCRDGAGRVLVHRRADGHPRFPGHYDWLVGGAADVGESWEEAAARELTEELGVRVDVRFVFKFLCRGPSVRTGSAFTKLSSPRRSLLIRRRSAGTGGSARASWGN